MLECNVNFIILSYSFRIFTLLCYHKVSIQPQKGMMEINCALLFN
jgi:hypothetical protein